MNYDNMTAVKCEGECLQSAEVTLAQTLNEATLMASDVLQMAYAIKRFTKKIMRGVTERTNCVLIIVHIVEQKCYPSRRKENDYD